jgi:hypothetical protein
VKEKVDWSSCAARLYTLTCMVCSIATCHAPYSHVKSFTFVAHTPAGSINVYNTGRIIKSRSYDSAAAVMQSVLLKRQWNSV